MTRKAKQYYYNAKYKKAYIENRLGLFDRDPDETDPRANLAITTTNDQMYRQQLVVAGSEAGEYFTESDQHRRSKIFRKIADAFQNIRFLRRKARVSESLDMILALIGAIKFFGVTIACIYIIF